MIDTQNYTGLPTDLGKSWHFCDDDDELLFLTEDTLDAKRGRFGFDVGAIRLGTGHRRHMRFSWRLYLMPELERMLADAGLDLLRVYGDDPAVVDWHEFRRGEPWLYSPDGFTDDAAKRIMLCRA